MKYEELIKQFMPIVESKVKIAYYKGKYWYVNPNSPNDLVSMTDTSLGIDSKGKHRVLSGDEEKKQLNAIKDAIKDGTLQNYKGIMNIEEAGKSFDTTQYDKDTFEIGDIIKKKLSGHPWEYDKEAKSWAILGDDNVIKFYNEFRNDDLSPREFKKKIFDILGKFKNYKYVMDLEDSYVLISLD